MQRDRLLGGSIIFTLIVLVGVGLWKTSGTSTPKRIVVRRHPRVVMGTSCTLAAVLPRQRADTEQLLQRTEAMLRAVEARMSSWFGESEIGRLNAAEADVEVPLSPETLEVLRLAREAHVETNGAFDVTCRPLIELWRNAPARGRVPSEAELADARAASHWDLIELGDRGATKHRATARVDLGGIAKGWAVDRAAEVLRQANVSGGLVDVGGDLVCFGTPPNGDAWPVDVQDPGGPGCLATLRLPGGAVCTSGNYARYVEIDGIRYSHIVDPRTGRAVNAALSVTIVADDAVTADVWATALSVLGPDGLLQLPQGVEAMMVLDTADGTEICSTPGLDALLEEPPSQN
jgi:thiamine biosynthesis lipoprotein